MLREASAITAPVTLAGIGYARISRDDAEQGRGVERQTDDIDRVASDQNVRLLCGDGYPRGVIVDNDFSASRYARKTRPGFQVLLSLLRSGAVVRLIVYNLDRLLRQPRELEDLIDLVETRPGLQVVTLSGRLDLSSREGRMFARMQVAMAAGEADATSERLRRHYEQLAEKGEPKGVGRARAFGYEADGKTIRLDEAEAYRKAVNDVILGESVANIVRRWNEAGFRSPQTDGAFVSWTVKNMLMNPRHAGLRVHRGEVVGKATWPAIITVEQHRRVVARLDDPAKRTGPRGPRSPLSGLLVNENGRKLRLSREGRSGRVRWSTRPDFPGEKYVSVTIRADVVEQHVLDLFFAAVDSGTLAQRVAARRKRAPKPLDVGDPVEIETELAALAADFGQGRIRRSEWLAAREPLEARLAAAQKAHSVDPAALSDSVLDDLGDIRERWETLSDDRKRAYLTAAFESIVIRRTRGHWRHENATERIEPRWRL